MRKYICNNGAKRYKCGMNAITIYAATHIAAGCNMANSTLTDEKPPNHHKHAKIYIQAQINIYKLHILSQRSNLYNAKPTIYRNYSQTTHNAALFSISTHQTQTCPTNSRNPKCMHDYASRIHTHLPPMSKL